MSAKKLPRVALIIAAHNEELVIAGLINSAIAAGQKPRDIYVVADSCSDKTKTIATQIVGSKNTTRVLKRSKARSIEHGVRRFKLTKRYDWIHIADADGAFSADYFTKLRQTLSPKHAAATGYIRSQRGSYISAFRALEYSWGMDFIRRTQSWLGVISVIPGPSSIFRADIFDHLDWHAPTVAEDFDVTLQIHRKNLGSIQYIPSIQAHTQDPFTFSDYIKQISRWNKGTLQSIVHHRIGTKPRMIDAYLGFQVIQSVVSVGILFLVLPIISILFQKPQIIAYTFMFDVALTIVLALFATIRTKRADPLTHFPLVYALKWIQALVFFRYFVTIYILRRDLTTTQWSHKVARYATEAQ